ncbi:MAG TPA: hypothetical protein VIU12_02585 [Chryseolinea sp.]
MDSLKTARIITLATAVLFAIAFSWLWSTQTSNESMRRELDQQKLRNEALLAEKLLGEKSAAQNDQLLSLTKDTVAYLTEQISLMRQRLSDQRKNYQVLTARCDLALRNLGKARAQQKNAEAILAQEQSYLEKIREENIRLFDSLRYYQTKGKWKGYIFF